MYINQTLLSMKRESSIGSSAFLFLLDLVLLRRDWASVDSPRSLPAAALPGFFFPSFVCVDEKIFSFLSRQNSL